MYIKYESENGFSGLLYGESSMIICDKEGKEVLHTAFRKPNTFEELKKAVDSMENLLKSIIKSKEEMLNEIQ